MPASPVPGSRPWASSPGAHRPAVHHRVAAGPASGRNHIDCVMPAHAARRQPGPRPGQPAPEEEITVTTGTPHAGPAARQARAATTAQAPKRLGLVLAVIATAQLMVAL